MVVLAPISTSSSICTKTDLGNFDIALAGRCKPETVGADHHSGVQCNAVADDAGMIHGSIGVEDGVFADGNVSADKNAGVHDGAPADFRAPGDKSTGKNYRVGRNACAFFKIRFGTYAGAAVVRRIKIVQDFSQRDIGVRNNDQVFPSAVVCGETRMADAFVSFSFFRYFLLAMNVRSP